MAEGCVPIVMYVSPSEPDERRERAIGLALLSCDDMDGVIGMCCGEESLPPREERL